MEKRVWLLLVLLLVGILVASNAGQATLTISSSTKTTRIDSAANGESEYCSKDPTTPLATGAKSYTKSYEFDMLYCSNITITAPADETFDANTRVALDSSMEGTGSGQDVNTANAEFCPATNPLVCGLKNTPDRNDMIDMLYCCKTSGIWVSKADTKELNVTELDAKITCPDGKALCGLQNEKGSVTRINRLYCCSYKTTPDTQCSKTDYAAGKCGDNAIAGSEKFTANKKRWVLKDTTPPTDSYFLDPAADISSGTPSKSAGYWILSTWLYTDTLVKDLRVEGYIDDTLTLKIYALQSDGTLKLVKDPPDTHACGGKCGTADNDPLDEGRKYSFDLPEFTPGWYLVEFHYRNWGDKENQANLVMNLVDTSRASVSIRSKFKVVNSDSPVRLDGDVSENVCKTPFQRSANAWAPNAPSSIDAQRICCGDDGAADYGASYTEKDGTTPRRTLICTKSGSTNAWVDVETLKDKPCLGPDGAELKGTQFNYDVFTSSSYSLAALNGMDACCGDDGGYSKGTLGSTKDLGFIFKIPVGSKYNYKFLCDRTVATDKTAIPSGWNYTWYPATQRFKIHTIDLAATS